MASARRKMPYSAITAAAGHYADAVMNGMPRERPPFTKQRAAWSVAFEAFKRGARWAHRMTARTKR